MSEAVEKPRMFPCGLVRRVALLVTWEGPVLNWACYHSPAQDLLMGRVEEFFAYVREELEGLLEREFAGRKDRAEKCFLLSPFIWSPWEDEVQVVVSWIRQCLPLDVAKSILRERGYVPGAGKE